MNVLIACNEEDTRLIFEDFCRNAQYRFLSLSDFSDSSGAVSQAFDIVVLEDCSLDPCALSIIEGLRKQVPSPFILVVGNNSEIAVSTALQLRADAFLAKPIQPALIALNFEQVCKRYELQGKVREAETESTRIQQQLRESLGRQRQATTEKNLTYRELLLAYSRLQDLNQQKNNFLSMATHELRTPVTVMKGYHRILLDERLGKLQPQQKEVLLESEQSCTRLVRIINSLLDLSRIEAGRLELIFRESDLAANIKSVIKQTKEACKRKDLSLVLRSEKGIPPFRFDRDRINLVVTHLLENSIKYTRPGGKIYVSVEPYFWERRTPPEDAEETLEDEWQQPTQGSPPTVANAVMVQVADTGIGISPEHQQEIFDQFTQVPFNQMNRSGLGLGLAISKRIIDTHGGKIWVDSRLNSGSRFVFVLPLNQPDDSNLNDEGLLPNRPSQESVAEKS
jgi:signal transduction histidine kinase